MSMDASLQAKNGGDFPKSACARSMRGPSAADQQLATKILVGMVALDFSKAVGAISRGPYPHRLYVCLMAHGTWPGGKLLAGGTRPSDRSLALRDLTWALYGNDRRLDEPSAAYLTEVRRLLRK